MVSYTIIRTHTSHSQTKLKTRRQHLPDLKPKYDQYYSHRSMDVQNDYTNMTFQLQSYPYL